MFQYFGSGRYKNRKYGITRKNTKAKSKTWFWISWFRKADRRTRPVHKSLREVNSKKHCGKLFLFFLLRKKFWKLWNIWIVEISTSTMQLSTQYEIEISTIQIKCPNFFVNKKKEKLLHDASSKLLHVKICEQAASAIPGRIRQFDLTLFWNEDFSLNLFCFQGSEKCATMVVCFRGKLTCGTSQIVKKKKQWHTHTHTHTFYRVTKTRCSSQNCKTKFVNFQRLLLGDQDFFLTIFSNTKWVVSFIYVPQQRS